MILCSINDLAQYRSISPRLSIAIDWVIANYKSTFSKGSISISNGIHVNCEEVAMMPREKKLLEAHQRYIDIHIPLSGIEVIGWSHTSNAKNVIEPYDVDRDIEFFGDKSQCTIPVMPGQVAIFFPEDAHAPCIGIGNHRKYCVKIAID